MTSFRFSGSPFAFPYLFKVTWCLFVTVFIHGSVGAQEEAFEPYKMKEVAVSDFIVESDLVDDEVDAVYLCNLGLSNVQISSTEAILEFTRSFRIKINASQGLRLADQVVELYVGETGEEKIGQVKGGVYNIQNGEVIFEKLKNKDWFVQSYNEHTKLARINFKNVKIGSIIELHYTVYSPFLVRMPDWNFQLDDHPVMYGEYFVRFPKRLGYKILQYGHHPELRSFHTTESEVRPLGISTERVEMEVYGLACENIPAMREEPLMDSPENYRLKVITELGYVDNPNRGRRYFYTDWENSIDKFMDLGHNDRYLDPKAEFDVLSSAGNHSDLTDSLRAIQGYIIDNFRRSGEQNRLVMERTPSEVFNSKNATDNEMNWLLLAVLRANGIAAYPVLVSRRSEQRIIRDYPMITQFSTCLVAVKTPEEYLLMDAATPYTGPGEVPEEYYNGEGLLIVDDKPKWIPVRGSSPSVRKCSIELDEFEAPTLRGEMRLTLSGIYRTEMKKRVLGDVPSDWRQILPITSNAQLTFLEESSDLESDPMEIRFRIEVDLEETGSSYLLSAVLFDDKIDNVLKKKRRRYPVNFPDVWEESYTCLVHLDTNGYEVNLPESGNYTLPNEGGKFVFLTNQLMGGTVLRSVVKVEKTTFSTGEYPALRRFYDLISDRHSSFVEIIEK